MVSFLLRRPRVFAGSAVFLTLGGRDNRSFLPESCRDTLLALQATLSETIRREAMRYVLAVAMLTTLVSPVYAQFGSNSGQKTPLQLKYEREEAEQKENERQYEIQMKRLK